MNATHSSGQERVKKGSGLIESRNKLEAYRYSGRCIAILAYFFIPVLCKLIRRIDADSQNFATFEGAGRGLISLKLLKCNSI